MDWFNTLLFYGYQESRELDKEDADIKLLPNVVDKIVLPKLIGAYYVSMINAHAASLLCQVFVMTVPSAIAPSGNYTWQNILVFN